MCDVIVPEGRGHESSKQGERMMPRMANGGLHREAVIRSQQ